MEYAHANMTSQNDIIGDLAVSYKITVQNKDVLYLDSHKNLLVCLEQSGIEVHSHCRDGFCGVCRVTVEKGDINYPKGEPLAYIGKDEILPCCCVPKSDLVITLE